MAGAANASGRLSPPDGAVPACCSGSLRLRGSIWGPRLEPSLTSQQWRLQSTNAVYWTRGRMEPAARRAASAVLWMQILVSLLPQPSLLQSLKVFQEAGSVAGRRRRWGASYGCDTGVGNDRSSGKLPSRRLRRFLWKLPRERCCVCRRVPLAGHLGMAVRAK